LCCVANRLTAHHDRIRHTIFRGSRGQKVDICTGLIHRLCRNVASRLSTNQVRHHFHLCCCFSSGYIGECRSCHTHRHRQFILFFETNRKHRPRNRKQIFSCGQHH